jgi:hypothetical protein
MFRVRQIAPDPDNQSPSTLGRIDYEDAFIVDVGPPHARRAEQWMRAILEEASVRARTRLLLGWSAIGLKVSLTATGSSVLGWEIRAGNDDFVLLGAESRIGMPGELLLRRDEQTLLFASFVRFDNQAARALWALVQPGHVRTVRSLLAQTVRRAVDQGSGNSGGAGGGGGGGSGAPGAGGVGPGATPGGGVAAGSRGC